MSLNSDMITANFSDRHGAWCRVLVLCGLSFLLLHALLSSNPYLQSSQSFFANHQSHRSSTDSTKSDTDISHIVFGVAGSVNTWRTRGPYIELWWRPNRTRGFVWLDTNPTDYPWPSTSPPFRVSEDTNRFKNYARHGMPFAVRMARVIVEAYRTGATAGGVRWFVMADDDTVLFADNLVEMLGRYDHRGYYYIGGISECVGQNSAHSFGMAFGGGGYAISYPLARALSRVMDGCLMRYPNLYGSDHVIQYCMAELGVSLTRHPGFHQLDLHGDISGLLSAHPQAPLLSFHHLDFVDPIFPAMTRHESLQHLMKAAIIDSSRLLQQTICYDKRSNWSLSVSWGYSVQIYEEIHPPGLLQIPLQTFKPWNNRARPPFMFNVRPPSNDPCMAPHIFYLKSVEAKGTDIIVGDYIRSRPRGLSPCRNHSAESISSVRVLSPAKRLEWDGGRRECCSVVPVWHPNATVIRIKACMENESLN